MRQQLTQFTSHSSQLTPRVPWPRGYLEVRVFFRGLADFQSIFAEEVAHVPTNKQHSISNVSHKGDPKRRLLEVLTIVNRLPLLHV